MEWYEGERPTGWDPIFRFRSLVQYAMTLRTLQTKITRSETTHSNNKRDLNAKVYEECSLQNSSSGGAWEMHTTTLTCSVWLLLTWLPTLRPRCGCAHIPSRLLRVSIDYSHGVSFRLCSSCIVSYNNTYFHPFTLGSFFRHSSSPYSWFFWIKVLERAFVRVRASRASPVTSR